MKVDGEIDPTRPLAREAVSRDGVMCDTSWVGWESLRPLEGGDR